MRIPTPSLSSSFSQLFLIAVGFFAIESSSPAATLVQESAYLLPTPPAGRPTGVGYFPAQQSLVVSANLDQPGQNGFARINNAGVSFVHGYYQNGSQYVPIQASGSETKITVVRDPGNAWTEGTLIYGDRIPSGGGSLLCLRIVGPTAVPGVASTFGVRSGTINIAVPLDTYAQPEQIVTVAVDETPGRSILGQGAICASNYGRVWRYNPLANPAVTLLATVRVDPSPAHEAYLEAILVMGNDAATVTRYGTRIAGKILVGADGNKDLNAVTFDNKGLWALDPASTTQTPDRILNQPVEDIDLIRANQALFVTDAGGQLFQFSSSQFSPIADSILLTVENAFQGTRDGQLRQLVRTAPASYASDALLAFFNNPEIALGLEHAVFAPIAISPSPVPQVSGLRAPGSPNSIVEPGNGGTPNDGTFRITRSGSTANDLIVRFRLLETSGSALAGSDFQFLDPLSSAELQIPSPMAITIPAGANFLDLTIQALADSAVEGTEVATLEIVSSVNYNIGTPSATISIQDSTTPTLPPSLTFTITPLFVSSGTGSDSYAFGVAADGSTIGQYRDVYPLSANPFKGFFRTPQGVYYVPEHGFSGYQMWPYGLNDNGVMVGGWFGNASNPVSAGAFKWSIANGITSLTGIPGVSLSQPLAYGINNFGIAVGQSKGPNGRIRAVKWASGATTAENLGTISGDDSPVDSYAFSISSNGEIAGSSGINGSIGLRAFRSYTTIDADKNLGTPQDTGTSEAFDINDLGEVVGRATFMISGTAQTRAFLRGRAGSLNQGFRDLGVLAGGNQSSAQSLNNHGHVVGWSRTTSSGVNRAVLWLNNGQMRNLNDTTLVSPLSGWTLTQAEDIGPSGHIVGWGIHNGVTRAFLLTPSVLG